VLSRLISWSLDHRGAVILAAVLVAAGGVWSALRLPLDAFPDTTPVQVQVNTVAPALSPEEMERQVTYPIERVLGGLPGLVLVRSVSKFGWSQVVVQFEDDVDIYLARQLVHERVQSVELPAGIDPPELGPISTGLGEVYHYLVRGEGYTLAELTTIHEWDVKPRLLSVPGVAEVNTWGGEYLQFQVRVDPTDLLAYDLVLDDLVTALRRNNLNVGGGNVVQAGELRLVQGLGLVETTDEIASIVVAAHDGVPVRVGDVGEVVRGHAIRRGAVTANGEGEVVLGLAFLLMGENSREVTRRLEAEMAEVEPGLPEGVRIETVYSRTELVDEVLGTVRENLLEGALLVVAVLFAFLGSLRSGLIVAAAIPFSMLFASNAMLQLGIAGSLMSLGAIDFGLIVDSSVILVENAARKLESAPPGADAREVVREAALEVRRPTLFGELIIAVVYLPVLTLEGIEGKLFRPMALTVLLALLGSLILSVTVVPALASLALPRRSGRGAGRVVAWAQAGYRPLVRFALRASVPVVAAAGLLLAGGVLLASQLGATFVPRLSEGSLVLNTVRLSGVSLEESVRYGGALERVLQEEFPDEVRDVWVRTGAAQITTDPMGIELSDVFVTLHPRDEWTRAETQEELTAVMAEEVADLPGMRVIFTQPIEMRVNEMVAGIRADLGVKVFGDDLERLKELGAEAQTVLESIPGSADVAVEQVTGQPVLAVAVDREALARHGVPARHVLEVVEALGGSQVGQVLRGERRFPLVVRLPEHLRHDPAALGGVLVPAVDGERLPLERLARIVEGVGPATITREWQRRRLVVQANVRGRDLASFVDEARERLAAELDLPEGYYLEFGGQFEHLERANRRLMLVVPLALLLILVLLHASTGSLRDSLLIFSGAPFAALGGVVALLLRDMPFTISAGVGFVAVSGVAMLNGLVLVATIRSRLDEGAGPREAIEEAALVRLRPVLMTALVAGLGFVPMAFNTGVGAEVQRPLATVVVAGVVSDNVLTLLVLPALYRLFGARGASATPPGSAAPATP